MKLITLNELENMDKRTTAYKQKLTTFHAQQQNLQNNMDFLQNIYKVSMLLTPAFRKHIQRVGGLSGGVGYILEGETITRQEIQDFKNATGLSWGELNRVIVHMYKILGHQK